VTCLVNWHILNRNNIYDSVLSNSFLSFLLISIITDYVLDFLSFCMLFSVK
jgi:hypothetical protein